MNVHDFEIKSMLYERKNAAAEGTWPIAIDIGYSGVKGMSPNKVFSFPAFARKTSGVFLAGADADPTDIQYRDESGLWNVGNTALATLDIKDTNDSEETLYGPDHIFSPMYRVVALTGIGIGMLSNQYGDPADKKLYIQTGLPPAYVKTQADALKKILAGTHRFELRVGNSDFVKLEITLEKEDIKVMDQPMGSLLSASLDNQGDRIPDAAKYLSSNVLILDGGFGTVDLFSIKHREIETPQSFNDCGMKAVFSKATAKIFEQYRVNIPVHALQKYLEKGSFVAFDREARSTENIEFDDIMIESSKTVCYDLLERIDSMYNNLLDYDYLLLTGGTGAAWQTIIKDYYAGMQNLTIIGGNQNDTFGHVYSNVRGYYLFLVNSLRKKG